MSDNSYYSGVVDYIHKTYGLNSGSASFVSKNGNVSVRSVGQEVPHGSVLQEVNPEITPDTIKRILAAASEYYLYQAVFGGHVNTPFGKVIMDSNGFFIIEQNRELMETLALESSDNGVKEAISRALEIS